MRPEPVPSNRRQFWRAAFEAPVRLTTHAGLVYGRLCDISLRGALVEGPAGWAPDAGEECLLQIDLAPGQSVSMWARVGHAAAPLFGLRCVSLDLDSATHLRRLLALNAGDAALLERELAALLAQ